jgi:hypothetical protein
LFDHKVQIRGNTEQPALTRAPIAGICACLLLVQQLGTRQGD